MTWWNENLRRGIRAWDQCKARREGNICRYIVKKIATRAILIRKRRNWRWLARRNEQASDRRPMSFRIRIIRCSLPLVAWGEKSSFRIKIASYLKANPAWKLDIIKFLIQVVSSSSILTYSRSLLFCIIRPSLSYYYSTVAQDKQWLRFVIYNVSGFFHLAFPHCQIPSCPLLSYHRAR